MLNIVGGSYYENCIQPFWDELFGSGLRAVLSLHGKCSMRFHTCADGNTGAILNDFSKQLKFDLKINPIHKNVEFVYEHPLSNPNYYPQKNSFFQTVPIKLETTENVICFGMIEGNPVISGNRVVYDPQDPSCPLSFSENGSKANELIYILNRSEAKLLCGSNDIDSIRQFVLNEEGALAAVIKSGADGAYIISEKGIIHIPAFMTEKVWPIGSGDIFTSQFGYHWMIRGKSIEESALEASKATAYFVNSRALPIPENLNIDFHPFWKKSREGKMVYLAGPFFNMGERWMINQFREALLRAGLQVFSPFHDVGIGEATKVATLDLKGVDDCDIILAIADGLDAGTLFEIGYGKAKGKPVIVYVESEKLESLTMLVGTNCILEDDFSTVIYKTLWLVYQE